MTINSINYFQQKKTPLIIRSNNNKLEVFQFNKFQHGPQSSQSGVFLGGDTSHMIV